MGTKRLSSKSGLFCYGTLWEWQLLSLCVSRPYLVQRTSGIRFRNNCATGCAVFAAEIAQLESLHISRSEANDLTCMFLLNLCDALFVFFWVWAQSPLLGNYLDWWVFESGECLYSLQMHIHSGTPQTLEHFWDLDMQFSKLLKCAGCACPYVNLKRAYRLWISNLIIDVCKRF